MKRFVWIGLGIWLVATVALRLAGGFLFAERTGNRTALLYAVTGFAIAFFISRLARALPSPNVALRAVVLVVVPGLLLDAGSVLWFDRVFPNVPESAGRPFASILLWCYGVALLVGLGPRIGRIAFLGRRT